MTTNNRFFLIDKPIWISSFDVIRNLRRTLNIKKMGHTGTLDPLASGLLLVATWNYTKLIPFLEKSKKTYNYTLNLSWTTESLDLWTEVELFPLGRVKEMSETLTKEGIEDVVSSSFIWNLTQVPPKYSALKINWKRAYELAREGKDVEIKSREIKVLSHIVNEFSFPEINLTACVSAGSYIRTLAYDIWLNLWEWAYVSFLRRVWIDDLSIEESVSLGDVTLENFLPINRLFPEDKFINLDDAELTDVLWWKFLPLKDYMSAWDIYFVEKHWEIVSVIECRENEFKAKTNI